MLFQPKKSRCLLNRQRSMRRPAVTPASVECGSDRARSGLRTRAFCQNLDAETASSKECCAPLTRSAPARPGVTFRFRVLTLATRSTRWPRTSREMKRWEWSFCAPDAPRSHLSTMCPRAKAVPVPLSLKALKLLYIALADESLESITVCSARRRGDHRLRCRTHR